MYKKHPTLNYWVSEDGFLIKQKGCGEKKSFVSRHGYAFIGYQGSSYYVHRLVYETFYGLIPEGFQINHINGNKLDNRLRNLEVVTPSQNLRHAHKTGLKHGIPGERNGMSKLDNESYFELIHDIVSGKTNNQIAEKYGLHSRYISLVRGRKRLNTIWKKYESIHGPVQVHKSGGPGSEAFSQKLALLRELPHSTNKALAEKYGLDPSLVSHIRRKKCWGEAWNFFEQQGATTSESVGSSDSKRGTPILGGDIVCSLW